LETLFAEDHAGNGCQLMSYEYNGRTSQSIRKSRLPVVPIGKGQACSRASRPVIYAYMMGYTNISNYDGSTYEWFFDPENPIESGYPDNWESFAVDEQFVERATALDGSGKTK
jgi:hypothetical protein